MIDKTILNTSLLLTKAEDGRILLHAALLLGTYAGGEIAHTYELTCMRTSISDIYLMTPNWAQHKCLPVGRGIIQ